MHCSSEAIGHIATLLDLLLAPTIQKLRICFLSKHNALWSADTARPRSRSIQSLVPPERRVREKNSSRNVRATLCALSFKS